MRLRDYQIKAIDDLMKSDDAVCVVAPTGAGKTVIASGLIAATPDKTYLVVAHRRELVLQTAAKIPGAGVLMAGCPPPDSGCRVVVASIQTLARRDYTAYDVVIIDEAHRATAASYKKVIEQHDGRVIGLTATPERLDGRGLDAVFKRLLLTKSTPELVDEGYLVPVQCYGSPRSIDTSGLRTVAGDFSQKELDSRINRKLLIGDIVDNWTRIAKGKSTVVFCVNLSHMHRVYDAFCEAGVSADVIHGGSKNRDIIMQKWKNGRTKVLVSVMVLVEGIDFPGLECCVFARPTKSITLYLQAVGRIMRPAEGKKNGILIDHANATAEHGLPVVERHWSLKGRRRMKRGDSVEVLQCPKCFVMYRPSKTILFSDLQPVRYDFKHIISLNNTEKSTQLCSNGHGNCVYCGDIKHFSKYLYKLDEINSVNGFCCDGCGSFYVHHVIHNRQTDEINNTSDELVLIDKMDVQKRIWSDFKKLEWVQKKKGFKKGWVYYKLRDKYGDQEVKKQLKGINWR